MPNPTGKAKPLKKRPNPSSENDAKKDVKKARADSGKSNGGKEAGLAAKPSVAVSASASPSPTFTSGNNDNITPSSKASFGYSLMSPFMKTNGGSSGNASSGGDTSSGGGNSFLKSLRFAGRATKDVVTRPTSSNASDPTSIKKEPSGESNAPQNGTASTSNGTGTAQSTQGLVVPFPYLPLDGFGHKIWLNPLALLLLFLLNAITVIYIVHDRKNQNMAQLKNHSELMRLNSELESSQTEVIVKRERMKALEQAQENRKAMKSNNVEAYTGILETMEGLGNGEMLTEEDRREWFNNFRTLEVDGQSALDEFNTKLSTF